MTINLKILNSAYIYDECEINELNTKELVPKMVLRRRLTRCAKVAMYLANRVEYNNERVVYGSAYGEVPATTNILNSIIKNEPISPTQFQNSVYNTAVSYLSMISKNEKEITTVSSSSKKVLECGAIKALDGDKLLLIATECINIDKIEEINSCIKYLESGVAMVVEYTTDKKTIEYNDKVDGFAPSIATMIDIAQKFDNTKENIIEVKI
jgi:hypothetical protein